MEQEPYPEKTEKLSQSAVDAPPNSGASQAAVNPDNSPDLKTGTGHSPQGSREDSRGTAMPAAERTGGTWLRRNRTALIITAVLVLLLASSGIALGVYTWDYGVIAEGVTVAGVPVGNLTPNEADKKLEERVRSILAQPVQLQVEGKVVQLSLEQLGLGLDTKGSVDQAYQIGREGSIAQRAISKRQASQQGAAFTLSKHWDEKKLEEALKQNLLAFNIPAQDASYSITTAAAMDIKPEKSGKLVDMTALEGTVKALDIFRPAEIAVQFKPDMPKLTAAQLEGQKITGLVASYTTSFDPSKVSRSTNLRVAAKALDGTVVKPGDTFSFNGVVGERTEDAGYQDALVIVNGEFVPGLGGGVCQVSSTLYNVLLLADLPIVERNNHSLVITYAPLGQDATVAYPSLDLKFKNDSSSYLLIRSKVTTNTITFYLYGQPNPDRQVLISNITNSVIPDKEQRVVDKSLPAGTTQIKQYGAPGYVVTSYRTVKIKGQVIKRESLGKSVYQPTPRIVLVGP